MIATNPTTPRRPAVPRSRRSTRASATRPPVSPGERASRFRRLQGCGSLPSADLAGRPVALSIDIPAAFDTPLAPHHKLVGRWAATREKAARRYTRDEARARIEHLFGSAVREILEPIELAKLRVVVIEGGGDHPPAIAVVCDSMGQLELGWIEQNNPLRADAPHRIAPAPWRATAYQALVDTLRTILPVFAYDDLLEEVSVYYWDGETTDEGARRVLVDYHGHDLDDLDGFTLPSAFAALRPDFMLTENVSPLKRLPSGLRRKIDALRKAHKAIKDSDRDGNAWQFDHYLSIEYGVANEDCAFLPPLTLVPVEQFIREIDEVCRHGMEYGFMDVAGLCPLSDANRLDQWFATLKLGADFLLAAQDLINLDPAKL